LLQDIVNKTNIAEAKAGVNLVDVNMEQAAKDGEDLGVMKNEESDVEDGGMSQLATILTSENQQRILDSKKAKKPHSDAIQAILTSAGVEYTHDNSEVIGSSKIEEQLSRRAAMSSYSSGEGNSALFADTGNERGKGLHGIYNPPEEVMLRHFCEMAKEFGFANATEFALVVESWTQEARRNCLDLFYKKREAKLIREGTINEEDVKGVAKDEAHGPDTTEEVKDDVKDKRVDNKPILKDEDIKKDDDKENVLKMESVKTEDIKMEKVKTDIVNTKIEDEKKAKTEVAGSSVRTSIFLSDDDDDDEL